MSQKRCAAKVIAAGRLFPLAKNSQIIEQTTLLSAVTDSRLAKVYLQDAVTTRSGLIS